MAYRISISSDLQSTMQTVAMEQIDKAVGETDDESIPYHERTHQVRKRLKKIRGLLRLVRPALGGQYSEANLYFRDFGRKLAGVRDAEAMVESLNALLKNSSGIESAKALEDVRKSLVERRIRLTYGSGSSEVTPEFLRSELGRSASLVSGWKLKFGRFKALSAGIRKTYARGHAARKLAFQDDSAEAFHEWRKRVKYHGYHVRLLRELWPEPMKARVSEAKRLSDILGDDHDLTVLRNHLGKEPDSALTQDAVERTLSAARQRSAELRAMAVPLGEKLFAEKPKHFVSRLNSFWESENS